MIGFNPFTPHPALSLRERVRMRVVRKGNRLAVKLV
jgi:hypothetical protein